MKGHTVTYNMSRWKLLNLETCKCPSVQTTASLQNHIWRNSKQLQSWNETSSNSVAIPTSDQRGSTIYVLPLGRLIN